MRARSVTSLATVVALFGAAAGVAACSTILGFEDVTLGDADGGVGGDATNGDGPRTDAPMNTDGPTTDSPTSETGSDAACGDTTMDPLNCGRCGHSCLKGTCMASVCQPYAVTTGYFGPWDLAVDATMVYFTLRDDNKVFKASKVDGSGATKLADQPDAIVPFAIVVDNTSVYWTNRNSSSGEVRKCALAGCPTANTSTLLATVDYPTSLLLVGSRIVWASNNGGTVTSADITNGGNQLVLFNGSGAANPYQIANDTDYVYATDNSSGITRRIPFDAGAAVALSDNGVMLSSGIAVGGGNVFYSGGDVNSGVLWRIAASQFTAGASATSYASSQKQPAGVAVDANNVYWVDTGGVDQNDGSVMMCPLSGCVTPVTLATGQHYPVRIKVDADAVYWTNYGISTSATDGSIWKVAKP